MPRRWVALLLIPLAGIACDGIDSLQPEVQPNFAAGFGTVGDIELTLGEPPADAPK